MTSRSVHLRVRRRAEPIHGDPGTKSWNLFARLSPDVAARLDDAALQLAPQDQGDDRTLPGWVVSSEKSSYCNSGVEFLPLSIALPTGGTVYVSYNGGDLETPTGEADPDFIDLPASMVPEGIEEVSVSALSVVNASNEADSNFSDLPASMVPKGPAKANLSVLSAVKNATDLHVEPLSVDDWVLLEANAEWLEQGGLLQQVSLVYPGQILTLCAGGRDVVRVRVASSNFASKQSLWPGDDDDTGVSSTHKCLRLVADTQVIVAPKTKAGEQTRDTAKLTIVPAINDYSESILELAGLLSVSLTDAAPCCAVVHPETFSRALGLSDTSQTAFAIVHIVNDDDTESSAETSRTAIARVSASEHVSEDSIVLDPLARKRLTALCFKDRVCLQIVDSAQAMRKADKLANLVRTGHVKLALEAVGTRSARVERLWRHPETSNASMEISSGSKELSPEQSTSAILLSMGDVPIEVGAFLQFAAGKMGSIDQMHRLVLSWPRDESHLKRLDLDHPFILARDLALLLDRPGSGRLPLPPMESMSECDSSPQSSFIIDPLPCASIFTSGMLDLVPRTVKHHRILLCGEKGSGKTHTAMVFSAFARLSFGGATLYLDCKKLKNSRGIRMQDILTELQQVFDEAGHTSPTMVVLDDLDELAPNYDEGGGADDSSQVQQVNPMAVDQSKLIADTVRYLIQATEHRTHAVSIIVTSCDAKSLPASIASSLSFRSSVQLPFITASDRETLYHRMLQRKGLAEGSLNFPGFERQTEGFRPRDIEQLASRVKQSLHSSNETGQSLLEATINVLKTFVPLSKLSAAPEQTHTSPNWDDVGGLFRVKEELTSTILRPFKYRRIYEKARIRLPRGVLLFGPPGCGKSFLVPALAKECGFPLITCRGPELLDKYIGASESKVREIFARAAAAAPSILFLDELDSLAPRRGSDHTGVTDRVVNQLLTFLDGVEDTQQSGTVYIVAATSRPDKIDAALLRPGRLEKHIYVGVPDQEEEWTDLLVKTASRYNVGDALIGHLSSGQFTREALEQYPFLSEMSPADLKSVFDTAQVSAAHEALAVDRVEDGLPLRLDHLMSAIPKTRPSLSKDESLRMQKNYRAFRKVGRGDKGNDTSGDPSHQAREPLRTALK